MLDNNLVASEGDNLIPMFVMNTHKSTTSPKGYRDEKFLSTLAFKQFTSESITQIKGNVYSLQQPTSSNLSKLAELTEMINKRISSSKKASTSCPSSNDLRSTRDDQQENILQVIQLSDSSVTTSQLLTGLIHLINNLLLAPLSSAKSRKKRPVTNVDSEDCQRHINN
ncbi:hypothetical protein L6452_36037 [Arctium lappa]|uniref:Uncharacterized protein n=1 Tax=Arctium lappa TaxID=4217 RepID=A0ACB8YCA3_ARCLA|nr:hypothetical protein L6452_36037 [Arctium lappa]